MARTYTLSLEKTRKNEKKKELPKYKSTQSDNLTQKAGYDAEANDGDTFFKCSAIFLNNLL